MLKNFFDFKIATYHRLSEVVLDEVNQADVIEIGEYVKGGIYHSENMIWYGSLKGIESFSQMIRSKKERKALRENKEWFESQGYRFEIVKMTKALFNEFYALYQQTTLKRERPLNFSLKEQILAKLFIEMPVYLIGMFKDDVLESGLVFSVSDEKKALVSFGAKKKFEDRRGGVGGVLELILIEYCLENSITEIGHGKSKNPAGITGKSGVFEFKARYGYSAFPTGVWKTTFILNSSIVLSDLVFVSVFKDQVGYIVVSNKPEEKVLKKYKTPEISNFMFYDFEEVERRGQKLLRTLKNK